MPSLELTPELVDSVCMLRLEEIERTKYPAQTKDGRAIKGALKVEVSSFSTHVVVIAIKKGESNELHRIRGSGGTAVFGYAYNSVEDCYYVRCTGSFELGSIPISFCIKSEGSSFWQVYVPLPEIVIKRYLDESQNIQLRTFKNSYKPEEYDFEYLQFIE